MTTDIYTGPMRYRSPDSLPQSKRHTYTSHDGGPLVITAPAERAGERVATVEGDPAREDTHRRAIAMCRGLDLLDSFGGAS